MHELTFLKFLLHFDEEIDTINDQLYKVDLWFTESIEVRDVECSVIRSCVYTTSTSLLQTTLQQDVIKPTKQQDVRKWYEMKPET